jgi:Tfp pilus assembly protein PilO
MTALPRWQLQRQVTLGVLLALLLQTSGALIWFGQVGERLDQLERTTTRQVPLAERLARLEAEMRLARESLVRIERRMDD